MMHYLDMFSQPEVTLLADVIEVGASVCLCVFMCTYIHVLVCTFSCCVCVHTVHVFLLHLQYLTARSKPFHPESVANDCKVSLTL